MKSRRHRNSMACACTTLGKMFFVKYFQKASEHYTFMNEAAKDEVVKDEESTDDVVRDTEQKQSALGFPKALCPVCMQQYEGLWHDHRKSLEHRIGIEKLPKCELCDFKFKHVKELLHHISRQYHKNTVEEMIENEELPPDYKDPILEVEGHDTEAEKHGIETKDSSNTNKPPEETMQISDGDVEREGGTETKTEDKSPEATNLESVSLYQDPHREFFGKTVTAIAECCNIKRVKTKHTKEELVKHLCSQEVYSQKDYYSGLTRNLNGIQKDVWKHVSRQDWIDVVEEYKSKVEKMIATSRVQIKQMQNYYENVQFVKEIRAEVEAQLTEESSIPHQCELLCQLGMKKYIHACRDAMVDWFCYVCMRDYVDYQIYSDHVRGIGYRKGHDENIIKAGTTIGNMFLIKYLQRNLIAAQHKEDSSDHSDHMDGGIKGEQDMSSDVEDGPVKPSQVRDQVRKAKELAELVDKDWFCNLNRLRDFMPQIPSVCKQLENCDDIREIQKEYISAVKEGKTTVENGNKDKEYGYRLSKYRDTKSYKPYEYKCKNLKGWIRSQKKLFAELNLSEEIKVVSMSDENKFTCFLCHSSIPTAKQYNEHITKRLHTGNMAGVCTTLGKMFFVKYLQKVAADVPEPHFCDLCMQKYTCSRSEHCKSQLHRARHANVPFCEVCCFNFGNVKDLHHHMSRQHHKNIVQQKIESGELPPDYTDPILKVKEDDADPETEDSSHTKPPEESMEIGGTDVEQEQKGGGIDGKDLGPINSESLSLFQNTDREFFGKTVAYIASHMRWRNMKQSPRKDQVIRDLCSEETYRQEDYYSDLSEHLLGIQKDVWKHVSLQDWIDVVEEYISKMNNVYEASMRQLKQTLTFFTSQRSVIELKAEVDAELTKESSIPHQWELLCQLGMKKYIHASRDAMVDWFCYVCMKDYYSYQSYKGHLRYMHYHKVTQAGTTIGNMFLIKFLLRSLVKMPEPHQFCSFCDVTHTYPYLHTIVNGKGPHGILEEQRRSGDMKCEVCDLVFLTQEERTQHCQNVRHNMVKVCKIQNGFLPADYKDEVEQDTAEEYDAEKQEETLDQEECSRMEEELKAMGQDAVTDYIHGFFCVPCNVFVNRVTWQDLEQTQKTHVGNKIHIENVKRYYQELDNKKKEDQEKIEASSSQSLDSTAKDACPINEETDKETKIDSSHEQSKNQNTRTEARREDDVNSLKRVNSTDHSKSPKRMKADQTINTSIRHDIPKKDSAQYGSINNDGSSKHDKSAKNEASKQQTQQEKVCKDDAGPKCEKDMGSAKREPVPKDGTGRKHAMKDKSAKDGASTQQGKACKLDASSTCEKAIKDTGSAKHEPVHKDGSGRKHATEDRSAKDGTSTQQGKACKLDASSAYEKAIKDAGSAKHEPVHKDGPGRKHSTEDEISDKNDEKSTKDGVRWDNNIKLVRCSVVLKRLSSSDIQEYMKNSTAGLSQEIEQESSKKDSGDKSSGSESSKECPSVTVERRKQAPGVGPKCMTKMKAKTKKKRLSSSSDSSTDSEDLPLSLHSKRTAKDKRGVRRKRASTEGSPLKIKQVELSHKKTLSSATTTEEKEKCKTVGRKERRSTSIDKSDNITSTSDVKQRVSETGDKKRRTLSTGSSTANVKSEADETDHKNRSPSVSSNPDIGHSTTHTVNVNSNKTAPIEKSQSASRRDSVANVDIADIFFRESDALRAKKSSGKAKAKVSKDGKTVDNSKSKLAVKDNTAL
ncbi:uncharacterized protein [Amphiura filiformis]|uniref:uncharacterized protein isoform X2 n=1 Tax=Amphiura filiformis TaxID=82378 RepID=UPI003B21495D